MPSCPRTPSGDPAKGDIVSSVCIACHGGGGNSTEPVIPRLAGQPAGYILKQLRDFKTGKRQNKNMEHLVGTLSEDDMSNVAAFFAVQKVVPTAISNQALVAKGKKLFDEGNKSKGVPTCSSCHGAKGEGGSATPRIASQHVAYTINQVKQFVTGMRKDSLETSILSELTAEDVEAVANYLASMP